VPGHGRDTEAVLAELAGGDASPQAT